MECRDVRPLIRRRHLLADLERQRVELHLHTCGACRDEADDSLAISFAGVSLPMAIPPPDFTRQVLLRLPAEAPLAIEQRRLRLQRLYRAAAAAGLGVLIVLALSGFILLYFSTQRAADHLPSIGLPLALAAKALLDAAGKLPVTILGIAAALLAPLLIRRIMSGAGSPKPSMRSVSMTTSERTPWRRSRSLVLNPLMTALTTIRVATPSMTLTMQTNAR